MKIRTTSAALLQNPADWNRTSQEAAKPHVHEIEVTAEPTHGQANVIDHIPAFLQRSVGDAELQNLQNKNFTRTFRIDKSAMLQLIEEGGRVGVDFSPMLAHLTEKEFPIPAKPPATKVSTPGTPTERKVFEGALLGAAVSAAIHAMRYANGVSGNIPFSALTTFACVVAGAVMWPSVTSIGMSVDKTGKVTGTLNVASQ